MATKSNTAPLDNGAEAGEDTAPNTRGRTSPSQVSKGRIVEQVVAMLHDTPGVTINRNVRMPSTKIPGRRREIDVLLTERVTGYRTQIAIECKNAHKPIGAPMIDAFVGKLQEVGVPRGIFVSASGYQGTVAKYAASVGIVPMTLHGLNKDRLSIAMKDAVQSVVHLLLDVTAVRVRADVPVAEQDKERLFWLYDQQGRPILMLLDLVWEAWLNGDIPEELGSYDLSIESSPEAACLIEGQRVHVSAEVSLQVLGLIVRFPGRAETLALSDGVTGALRRGSVQARFDIPEGTYPVTTVRTEEELDRQLEVDEPVALSLGRVRLPRIRDLYRGIYWPPSQRVGELMIQRVNQLMTDPSLSLPPLTSSDVEGLDMHSLWDPIWDVHPAGQNDEVPAL